MTAATLPQFRTLIEYQGALTPFTDLGDVCAYIWGKPFDEITYWFGECPVVALSDLLAEPDVDYVRELLPPAQVFAERYRTLVPIDLGINFGELDFRYLLRVGMWDGKSIPSDHKSFMTWYTCEGWVSSGYWGVDSVNAPVRYCSVMQGFVSDVPRKIYYTR